MKSVTLDVLGTPAPQGSKRHVGNGRMVESSKAVGPWREAVVSEARRTMVEGLMLDGPLRVIVDFRLCRPHGHHGAKGLRPSAPRWPHVKPDIDKLLRSTLDGLTQAGVIADDARIVEVLAVKAYADSGPAGARITVESLAPEQVTP
jgi:crossover junction endodeoxyribonuclease RusA